MASGPIYHNMRASRTSSRPPLRLLISVITLVGLLHYYIGAQLIPALPWSGWPEVLAWALLCASALLQPLGLLARGIRNPRLRDANSWIAMTMMGVFSSLLVMTLLRDVILLLAMGLNALQITQADLPTLRMHSALLAVLVAASISVAGFVNARRLAKVVHIQVPLRNLPAQLQGFRIVQISDIHVGPTIKQHYLQRIVNRVNTLEADLIAITGDLVDGRVSDLAAHTQPMSGLSARHGSYFVTGNHEYYSGALAWIAELERLGIRVLLNEHVQLSHEDATLVLAGVTDYSAAAFDASHRSDPHAAIAGAPADAPKILLAHQPRSAIAAQAAGFDLQLSGHTHGGQFWPWGYFVPLQQPYVAGLHQLQDLWIYVSRGTGYWGPPNRFGAPSEITCLTLVSA